MPEHWRNFVGFLSAFVADIHVRDGCCIVRRAADVRPSLQKPSLHGVSSLDL